MEHRTATRVARLAAVAATLAIAAIGCTPEPPDTGPTTIAAAGPTTLVGDTAVAYPSPLAVVVSDGTGQPVQGATVTFAVAELPPALPFERSRARIAFDGATAPGDVATLATGADGTAAVSAIANEWIGTVGVTASVDTTTGPQTVAFRLTNRIRPHEGFYPPDTWFQPGGPVFDGSNVWVADDGNAVHARDLKKFRARDGQLLATFPTATLLHPVITADADHVWMGGVPGEVQAFDPDDGEVLQRFAISGTPVAMLRTDHHLWIASSDGTLTGRNPASGIVQVTIPLASTTTLPQWMAFDGTYLWVSAIDSRQVVQIDDATGAVVRRIPFGCPAGLAHDGADLWVASPCFGTITKLRTSDATNLGDFPVATRNLVFDGTRIWAVSSGGLSAIDPASGNVTSVRSIPPRCASNNVPILGAMAFDDTNLWVQATNCGLVAITP